MITGFCAPRTRSGGRARLGLLALAAMAATSPGICPGARARTWPAPMAAPAPTPVFAIKGFKVTGENPLGDGETARVLAPFLRADATIETPAESHRRAGSGAARQGLRIAPRCPAAAGSGRYRHAEHREVQRRQGQHRRAQHLRRGQHPAQPAGAARRATAPISSSSPSRRPSPTRTPTSRSRWACAKRTSRTRSMPPSR